MRKINSRLLNKSFDLKNKNINGGLSAYTYKDCKTKTTDSEGCTVTTTVRSDDFGTVLTTSSETVCP